MPFALKEKGFEQREIGVLADVHILTGKRRSNRGVGFSHLWLVGLHTLWLVGSHTLWLEEPLMNLMKETAFFLREVLVMEITKTQKL